MSHASCKSKRGPEQQLRPVYRRDTALAARSASAAISARSHERPGFGPVGAGARRVGIDAAPTRVRVGLAAIEVEAVLHLVARFVAPGLPLGDTRALAATPTTGAAT